MYSKTSDAVRPRFFFFLVLLDLELVVEAKTTPLDDIESDERGVSGGDHLKRTKTWDILGWQFSGDGWAASPASDG